MVKKASIFTRIADRFRSGSGVKVEASRTDGARPNGGAPARPAVASVSRVEPRNGNGNELPSAGLAADVKSTRKLSEREEAMVAVGSHFQELATLMRGVHSRLDGHLGKLVETATSLQQLPALSQQQLELLRGIAGHMEKQNALGERVADTLGALPALLQSVDAALARAAQSDERTAATMREFQSTMDRIHSSMGQMVQHSEQQAKATQSLAAEREESLRTLATGFEQAQKSSVQELRTAADEGLQSLRRSHEDQSNRLQKVVAQQAGMNKAMLAVLGVVALGMIALLIVQLLK